MTTKKPTKPKSPKITFSVQEETTTQPDVISEMKNMIGMHEYLSKSAEAKVVKKDMEGKYTKSKVTFASKDYSQITENVYDKGWRRLSDSEQRELVQLDTFLSAIIATRVSQSSICASISESNFDKGT